MVHIDSMITISINLILYSIYSLQCGLSCSPKLFLLNKEQLVQKFWTTFFQIHCTMYDECMYDECTCDSSCEYCIILHRKRILDSTVTWLCIVSIGDVALVLVIGWLILFKNLFKQPKLFCSTRTTCSKIFQSCFRPHCL